MCNLYSLVSNQEAIRRLFRVDHDAAGNLPPMPAIFPDTPAPVIGRRPDGSRTLARLRWGMPPPAAGAAPVTNIRNLGSPHWRPWLGQRCLVPATAFCEWQDAKPRKIPTWFARDDTRPLFAFAGIWCWWTGTRGTKSDPVAGRHAVFGFLTTAANGVVGPVHPKAMPVILTGPDAFDTWLDGPDEEALALARPLPDADLAIVARGEREDGPPYSSPSGITSTSTDNFCEPETSTIPSTGDTSP